jgi:hypothetical protein
MVVFDDGLLHKTLSESYCVKQAIKMSFDKKAYAWYKGGLICTCLIK